MVEWGTVQTKDMLAKMVIEEGNGGSHFKQALRKVWVQMSELPEELSEYLTIWAIGTIIGVTKDVDMKFTREFDRAHFQVLVLNPSLIPHSIDVVIGEYIYEVHFWVERDDMIHPIPIDMDDDTMDDREEEGNGGGNKSSVSSSLNSLRQAELYRMSSIPKMNKVENIFDEEEKEMENEEVDRKKRRWKMRG
jgi:hypothetical protein